MSILFSAVTVVAQQVPHETQQEEDSTIIPTEISSKNLNVSIALLSEEGGLAVYVGNISGKPISLRTNWFEGQRFTVSGKNEETEFGCLSSGESTIQPDNATITLSPGSNVFLISGFPWHCAPFLSNPPLVQKLEGEVTISHEIFHWAKLTVKHFQRDATWRIEAVESTSGRANPTDEEVLADLKVLHAAMTKYLKAHDGVWLQPIKYLMPRNLTERKCLKKEPFFCPPLWMWKGSHGAWELGSSARDLVTKILLQSGMRNRRHGILKGVIRWMNRTSNESLDGALNH